MRSRKPRGKAKGISKTERIANVFMARPLDPISPKEISGELELDIQLVTSIVSRLRSEGLIERVSWGRYRLKLERSIDEEKIALIAKDMFEITSNILGTGEEMISDRDTENPFNHLIDIYREVSRIGGDTMARNLLRLSARKNLPPEKVSVLVNSIREVVGE